MAKCQNTEITVWCQFFQWCILYCTKYVTICYKPNEYGRFVIFTKKCSYSWQLRIVGGDNAVGRRVPDSPPVITWCLVKFWTHYAQTYIEYRLWWPIFVFFFTLQALNCRTKWYFWWGRFSTTPFLGPIFWFVKSRKEESHFKIWTLIDQFSAKVLVGCG